VTDLETLLAAAAAGPVPDAGFRVLDALRARHGAREADVARLLRWSGQLQARIRGEAAPPPSDPLQRPTILYLDGFSDRAWHEAARYPVTAVLESVAGMIRSELIDRIPDPPDWPEYREGVAEDGKWRACWFYRYGRRVHETAALFPRTAALLDAHSGPEGPLASSLGDVFLSRLEPGGRIPAHNGLCNISLVGHLALVVPPRCGIRVGAEWREWAEGKTLVFDDTFEHECRNDSDADRYVLVFTLWQDGVSAIEREFIHAMTRWLNDVVARG
jgi:aspartate beta-hydroxylase